MNDHGNHDGDIPAALRATTAERIEAIRHTLTRLKGTRHTTGLYVGMDVTPISYGGLLDLLAEHDRLRGELAVAQKVIAECRKETYEAIACAVLKGDIDGAVDHMRDVFAGLGGVEEVDAEKGGS
jgi:hypothetical protein